MKASEDTVVTDTNLNKSNLKEVEEVKDKKEWGISIAEPKQFTIYYQCLPDFVGFI